MNQGPEFSKALGNIDDQNYNQLLDLAARDPRAAMMFASHLLGAGDGGNYAAIACNLIAVISYARHLEVSDVERNAVFADPIWEGYPPLHIEMLFVAFRLRYQAGRTKTTPYERARIHFTAIRPAYRQGIRLDQVRAYIEEHGIEMLYSWSQRTHDTQTFDAQPVAPRYAVGGLETSGQQQTLTPPSPSHAEGDQGGGDDPIPTPDASAPAGPPPGRKPPKSPKYADNVPPARTIEVRLTDEDFDFAVGEDGPEEFTVRCYRKPNGGSKWVRIDGIIL